MASHGISGGIRKEEAEAPSTPGPRKALVTHVSKSPCTWQRMAVISLTLKPQKSLFSSHCSFHHRTVHAQRHRRSSLGTHSGLRALRGTAGVVPGALSARGGVGQCSGPAGAPSSAPPRPCWVLLLCASVAGPPGLHRHLCHFSQHAGSCPQNSVTLQPSCFHTLHHAAQQESLDETQKPAWTVRSWLVCSALVNTASEPVRLLWVPVTEHLPEDGSICFPLGQQAHTSGAPAFPCLQAAPP